MTTMITEAEWQAFKQEVEVTCFYYEEPFKGEALPLSAVAEWMIQQPGALEKFLAQYRGDRDDVRMLYETEIFEDGKMLYPKCGLERRVVQAWIDRWHSEQ